MSGDGELWPHDPPLPQRRRALGEAFVSERWPIHPAWSGERVLDRDALRARV